MLIFSNAYIKLQTIGFMGPAATLICLNYANTPTMAATLLTAALSLSSFSQAGFMLNIQVSLAHKNLNILLNFKHYINDISGTYKYISNLLHFTLSGHCSSLCRNFTW